MKSLSFRAISLSFLALLLFTGITNAANCRVTKTADTADGSCDAGDCSLREAVAEPSCTLIDFSLNLVQQPININLGDIVINRSLTIKGYGADAITIASNNVFRIFYIAPGGPVVKISGVKLTGGGGNGTGPGGGGAIRNSGGNLTLDRVYLTGNSSQGGAALSGSALIKNSTIANNTSGAGSYDAAITTGSVALYNSTVCDNVGRGIATMGGFVSTINSTIAFNGPTGVLVDELGILTAGNSVIQGYDRGHPNFGGDVESRGSNIASYAPGSFSWGFTNADQVGVDPMLAPLGYYGGPVPTRPLLASSPGIDRGNNQETINLGLTTDQRGHLRFFDGDGNGSAIVDVGAFEFGAPVASTVTVAGRVLGVSGNPMRSQTVTFSDLQGNTRTALSSSFGWFVFDNVPADAVYRIRVNARRGAIEKLVFADQSISDADIIIPGS